MAALQDLPLENVATVWVSAASFGLAEHVPGEHNLIAAFLEAGPPASYVFVNDVVSILLAPPLEGYGIVISSGCGSCVVGRSVAGEVLSIGGKEYVISDFGSAYAIGLEGLRAASRGHEGLHKAEALLDLARRHFGLDIPMLGRSLAASPAVKTKVASFAPAVCSAAQMGDPTAFDIIKSAAYDLAQSFAVLADRLNLSDNIPIVLSGGAFNCALLVRLVKEFIPQDREIDRIKRVSPINCALQLAIMYSGGDGRMSLMRKLRAGINCTLAWRA
jgi:N-acetylglucosamine kinase-like BadF-type ATPase